MRFFDPLAAMKFMGCTPSIQIFLCVYAIFIYYNNLMKVRCGDDDELT